MGAGRGLCHSSESRQLTPQLPSGMLWRGLSVFFFVTTGLGAGAGAEADE